MQKSSIPDKNPELIFNNSNQFLSDDKGNQNTELTLNGDMMKVLDESGQIDLKFCISRETLYKKLKSVK